MKVAVITPTFNRDKYTEKFIEQLERQSHKDLTLIMVDSGSSDQTLSIAKSLAVSLPIKIFTVPRTYFWTAATNVGVEFALKSGFDAILTLNDDSFFSDTLVSDLVEFLNEHPSYSMAASRIDFYKKKDLIWQAGARFDWQHGAIFTGNFSNQQWSLFSDRYPAGKVIDVSANCGNGILFRKEVFEKIGLYNQRWCPHYHADTELTLRATSKGLNLAVLPWVILENDFPDDSKFFNRFTFITLFTSVRSPFYLPSIFYVVLRYCPLRLAHKNIFRYLKSGLSVYLKNRKAINALV